MDKFTAMKREPCHKCDQPVFLAERFCVGAALYHRQCLKCARCGSQLKAGSFYETEVDGEFCCETCPDEEQVMRRRDESQMETETEEKRFSVADKVALFQRVDLELTKKSLSDEEKRASLQRLASLTLVTQDHQQGETEDIKVNGVDEDMENSDSSLNDSESEGEVEPLESTNVSIIENLEDSTTEPSCDSNKPAVVVEAQIIETETLDVTTDPSCSTSTNDVAVAQTITTETKQLPNSLVDLTIHALIRLQVEEIVTSVLKEAAEKVQLIQETELNVNSTEVGPTENEQIEAVPLEVGPKPVPRIRTLDRNKKQNDGEKPVEKPTRPARPPPPVMEKPPIKPRPVSLAPKKMYPDDLNPFGSDDEEEAEIKVEEKISNGPPKNPFGSDTEEEVEIIETK